VSARENCESEREKEKERECVKKESVYACSVRRAIDSKRKLDRYYEWVRDTATGREKSRKRGLGDRRRGEGEGLICKLASPIWMYCNMLPCVL